jgi:hypothetical protein
MALTLPRKGQAFGDYPKESVSRLAPGGVNVFSPSLDSGPSAAAS